MKQSANDNSPRVAEHAKSCPKGDWSFLGPGEERWCTALARKPHGLWSRAAEEMMNTCVAIWHLVLRGTSLLSRGPLKSNGGGKTSIHFNAEPDTAELLLRSVVSVYQFSFYGAVADWCEELSQRDEDHPSPEHSGGGPSRKWLLTKLSKFRPKVCRVLPMVHYGANERGNTMKKLTIFQKIFNLQKLVPTQDLQENVSEGQHSITIPNVHVEGYGTTSSCREDTYP